MSFRAGLLLGALTALVTAALLAPRVEHSLMAFVVLAGSGALALGPLLAGIAQALPFGRGTRALLAGLGLSALPLCIFITLLKSATHHRPLGAVTFGFLALLMIASAALLSLRGFSILEARVPVRYRATALAALGLLAALGPLLLLGRALLSPALATGVTDAAIALGTGAVLLRIRWPSKVEQLAHRAGVWVWLAVVLAGAGFAMLEGSEAAGVASPVLLAPFAWFVG